MSKESAFEVGRLYLPIQTIAETLTASQKDIFVRLPGLTAYFPCSIRDQSGNVVNHTAAAGHLTETGSCPTGFDGNPYVHLGNGTNYLVGSNPFGFTGAESWIDTSIQGFTVGGWFQADTSPAQDSALAAKDTSVPDRGWALLWQASDIPMFFVSGNGSAVSVVTSGALSVGAWHWIVGRFKPSTEVAIFQDGDKAVNTTAIPSTINVSAASMEVGRYVQDNSRIIHGRARDLFLCASALSDAVIEQLRVTSVP